MVRGRERERWRGGRGQKGAEAAAAVVISPPLLSPLPLGEGKRVGRVTFSHLRVLVTMILLDEAVATIVKPFPWVVLEIFESFRHDLNHRPRQFARDRYNVNDGSSVSRSSRTPSELSLSLESSLDRRINRLTGRDIKISKIHTYRRSSIIVLNRIEFKENKNKKVLSFEGRGKKHETR